MDGSHAAKEPEKVVFPPSLQCSREVRRWLSHAISHLILQRERKTSWVVPREHLELSSLEQENKEGRELLLLF